MQPVRRRHSLTGSRAATLAAVVLACAGTARAAIITEWDVAAATGQTVSVLTSAADTSASIIDSVGVSQWASTAESGFAAARTSSPCCRVAVAPATGS